jgi:hypothetical protein
MKTETCVPDGALLTITKHSYSESRMYITTPDSRYDDIICASGEIVLYMGSYKQIGEVDNTSINWIAILHPIHGPGIIDSESTVWLC